MTQQITVKEVVTACKAALKNFTLGGFNHDACYYAYDDGSRCAVGTVLTDESLAKIREDDRNASDVGDLENAGIIVCDDYASISRIQTLHDEWAQVYNLGGLGESSVRNYRLQRFVQYINGIQVDDSTIPAELL